MTNAKQEIAELIEDLPNNTELTKALEAIPVGVDLSEVTNKFLVLMLKRVKGYTDDKKVLGIIDRTIKVLEGGEDEELQRDAKDVARAAYDNYVAWAAIRATYAAVATAVATTAAFATATYAYANAANATYAVATYDDVAAVDATERTQQKDDLLMLLRRAK